MEVSVRYQRARDDNKCACSHVDSDRDRYGLFQLDHGRTIAEVSGNNNFIFCAFNLIWP